MLAGQLLILLAQLGVGVLELAAQIAAAALEVLRLRLALLVA